MDENHRKWHAGKYDGIDGAEPSPEGDFTPDAEANKRMKANQQKLDEATKDEPVADKARTLRSRSQKALDDMGL